MHEKICSVLGCDRTTIGNKNMCRMHYRRWKTHGDPNIVLISGEKAKFETYNSVHNWLWRHSGPARYLDCVDCGLPARDWAYNHGCADEAISTAKLTLNRVWCPHPEHYSPRCRHCHDRLDQTPRARGEATGAAKLTEADVRWLRAQTIGKNLTYVDLARILGVSSFTVREAYHRRSWKHVE